MLYTQSKPKTYILITLEQTAIKQLINPKIHHYFPLLCITSKTTRLNENH